MASRTLGRSGQPAGSKYSGAVRPGVRRLYRRRRARTRRSRNGAASDCMASSPRRARSCWLVASNRKDRNPEHDSLARRNKRESFARRLEMSASYLRLPHRMECSICGGSERRPSPTPYRCPWCGEGAMMPPPDVERVSYSECAAKRGFTCILGTGCDQTPICPRPGCAARDNVHGTGQIK